MQPCNANVCQQETATMSKITQVANQLTTETTAALSSAKALKSDKSLSLSERNQVSDATELLEQQGRYAKYLVDELRPFTKTFVKWVNDLAKQHERQGGDSSALLGNNLRTKDGYSLSGVKMNVDNHIGFVTKTASEGIQSVANAIQTLNSVAASKGAPRIPDVSATWAKAANPASW